MVNNSLSSEVWLDREQVEYYEYVCLSVIIIVILEME